MKDVIRRIVVEVSESGALTHLLPYEARITARRAARAAEPVRPPA
jgi:hypothetical protein